MLSLQLFFIFANHFISILLTCPFIFNSFAHQPYAWHSPLSKLFRTSLHPQKPYQHFHIFPYQKVLGLRLMNDPVISHRIRSSWIIGGHKGRARRMWTGTLPRTICAAARVWNDSSFKYRYSQLFASIDNHINFPELSNVQNEFVKSIGPILSL